MPAPKIFVSSTCYDLANAREQIRSFITRMGYDPVMSEYSDVLYDPREHTHSSCVNEVPNVDMVVLVIGSRFGGTALPEAVLHVDFDNLRTLSRNTQALEHTDNISITQLEILKAIESKVPVFSFVDERVMSDHHVYQRNKGISEQIIYPSIDKPASSKYIFEFINFLSQRTQNNSVIPFTRIEDIESHLKKQWAAMFQRFLRESREKQNEAIKIQSISEQLEDLKSAVISTITGPDGKATARGVMRYRRLTDFLKGFDFPDPSQIHSFEGPLNELLKLVKIESIVEVDNSRPTFLSSSTIFIVDDNTYYEARISKTLIMKFANDWDAFSREEARTRQIIFDAVTEDARAPMGLLRRHTGNYKKSLDPSADEVGEVKPLGELLSTAVKGLDQTSLVD